jgi:LAO/AO transport system kinase
MMLEIENGGTRMIRHHGQLLRVETPAAVAAEWDDEKRWQVIVMKTVATDGGGIAELRERIEAHRRWLQESGEMAVREQLRIANTLENIVRAELNRRILERLPAAGLGGLVEAIRARATDPYSAAGELLAAI